MLDTFVAIVALTSLQPTPGDPAPPIAEAVALAATGLSAETLAASGLSAQAAAQLRAAVAGSEAGLALWGLHLAADEAGVALRAARDSAALAPTSEGRRAALGAAEAAWAARRTDVENATAAVRQAAAAAAPADTRERLAACQAAARRRVPAAWKVLSLTDQQWRALERALRDEERSGRTGGPLPDAATGLLASVRSNPEVVAAQLAIDANAAAIGVGWK